ncbi:hypothetical protein [Nostoc sp.]|uniref:hypothetical protein n=1 Tax=Nostoc sp. TaxID=1180 RepID=UPI002FF5CF32
MKLSNFNFNIHFFIDPIPNGTKKRRKACVTSFPVFRLGMYSKGLLPLVKPLEAAALREWVPSLQTLNQLGQSL